MDDFRAADWALLGRQRQVYLPEERPRQALALLKAQEHDPSFGYAINTFRHNIQTATLLMADGHDEEMIVCGLFHDLGFILCDDAHGLFAAALLGPYVCERNRWMLERHAVFQQAHAHELPGCDPHERDRWRGHPHFDWTAQFVAKYDQNAMSADFENAPLSVFEPMVHRIFARKPAALPIP